MIALTVTIKRSSRDQLAEVIERLINLLDQIDGDPDLEPSLAGWQGGPDDREDDPAEGPEETYWRPGVECSLSRATLEAREKAA